MFSLRRLFIEAILPALCIIGAGYNLLIMLNGEEGLRAHDIVEAKKERREDELVRLQRHRDELERRADLLSMNSLNRDMLDESARRVLGFAAPGENVISIQELDLLLKTASEDPAS